VPFLSCTAAPALETLAAKRHTEYSLGPLAPGTGKRLKTHQLQSGAAKWAKSASGNRRCRSRVHSPTACHKLETTDVLSRNSISYSPVR
jgi:hypothetical protein